MTMVCGLDLHRRQITFDVVEVESGEEWRGRIWQPDRERFRRWLRDDVSPSSRRRPGGVGGGGLHRLALRGGGDRRGGVRGASGRAGRHASSAGSQASRQDRPHRCSVAARVCWRRASCPESWIPPEGVLEWRERVRLYMSLVNQRTVWCQRIHAELYQHGVAVPEGAIRTAKTRGMLADDALRLSPAARQRIRVGYSHDRRDRRRGPAAQTRSATLRCPPAGMSGVARRAVRHRWADRGGGVVRARRLPTLLPLRNRWCATPAWMSPSIRRTGAAPAGICPGKDRRRCGGRSTKQPRTPHTSAVPTTTTTQQ